MSNKTKLQQHNAILSTALDNIHGLPMADDVKHGVYAWGKYAGRTVDTIPYSITETVDMGNPAEFTIYKDVEITNGVAIGIDANTVYIYDMAGGEDITSAEYPYYIYDGIAYVDARISRNTLYVQGNKIKTGKGDFFETVVSDISNKYLDDGEQDGYYYKKLHAENATEYGIFFNASDSNGNPVDVKIVQKDISKLLYRTSATYAYMFNNLKRLDIIATNIYDSAFGFALYNANEPFKMRLKCYHIGLEAFLGLCAGSNSNCSVWISKDCTTINATTYSNGPFQGAAGKTKLYCEVGTKPSGWGPYWYYYNAAGYLTVTWGVTESRFAELGNI